MDENFERLNSLYNLHGTSEFSEPRFRRIFYSKKSKSYLGPKIAVIVSQAMKKPNATEWFFLKKF